MGDDEKKHISPAVARDDKGFGPKGPGCCTKEAPQALEAESDGHELGPNPGHTEKTFALEGMTCVSCALKVEAALNGLGGVISARVDLARAETSVKYDPEKVGPEDLGAAVEAAGYRLSERRVSFDLAADDHCGTPGTLSWGLKTYLIGALAGISVVGLYLGLMTVMADWQFAKMQFDEYRWWILALAFGLGVQATLYTALRSSLVGTGKMAAKSSLAASGGVSATAMAACCAHYLAAFLPALGLPFLTAAAAGLDQYQTYFFAAGVVSNLFGVAIMLRFLKGHGLILMGPLAAKKIRIEEV